MIIDDAVNNPDSKVMLTDRHLRKVRDARARARRFVFDEAASARAGRFATECADLVCRHSQFALPPFPNTYVEIDQHASLRASSETPVEVGTAKRVGYLFHEDGDVYVCAGGDYQPTRFEPLRYHRKEGGDAFGMPDSPAFLKHFLIGEVAAGLRSSVDEFAAAVTDVWSVSATRDLGEARDIVIIECVGEFKRALAALLLLNQKRGMAVRDVGPTRRMSRGKLKTYMAHSVVSVDLDAADLRASFSEDSRASPRRHEVRGHFVHYGIDDRCGHEWEAYFDAELERRDVDRNGRPTLRWRCRHCAGLRVRREAFHRGDAERGFVVKAYAVKG